MKLHIGGKEKKEGWSILNIQKNDGVDFKQPAPPKLRCIDEENNCIPGKLVLENSNDK